LKRRFALRLFEIANVLVRLDHVARCIVNANHGIVRPAVKFCVTNCMVGRIGLGVPQPTKWQRIGNQIDNRDDLCAGALRKRASKCGERLAGAIS
jgi:hypothetical protein